MSVANFLHTNNLSKEDAMKGFVKNITEISVKNEFFRQVLYTAKSCQLVIMALKPGEDIGMEDQQLDQFFLVRLKFLVAARSIH
jgi:hypothetical protein